MNPVFLTINHLNRNRYVKAFSILLFLLSASIFSQSSDTPYEFPILKNISEGGQSINHLEMIGRYQIPDDILKNMSTKALIKTCLRYPLLRDIFMYNNFQLGFERVASAFNGLITLFQRSNAAEAIVQEYLTMSNFVSENASNFYDKFQIIHIEMFLAQPQVLNNLTNTKKDTLFHEVSNKFFAKYKNLEKYGCLLITPSCLILARLLLYGQDKIDKNKLDFKITKFAENPSIVDFETMHAIAEASEQYLTN